MPLELPPERRRFFVLTKLQLMGMGQLLMEEPRKTTRPAKPANESGFRKAVKPLTIFVARRSLCRRKTRRFQSSIMGCCMATGFSKGFVLQRGRFPVGKNTWTGYGFGPLDLPGFTDVTQRDDGGSGLKRSAKMICAMATFA